MSKNKHPKVIADFYKKYAHLEKLKTLEVNLEILRNPKVSDDISIETYDVYSAEHTSELGDLLYFSQEEERQNFKDNFITLLKAENEEYEVIPLQVIGVFLNEETEGFPVYIISDYTQCLPEKISDSLNNFTKRYLSKEKPAEAIKKLEQELPKLDSQKDYKDMLLLLNVFFKKHQDFIKEIERSRPMENRELKSNLGKLYNYSGSAKLELSEDIQNAVADFERSCKFRDSNGFKNLIKVLCYTVKDYPRVQALTREFSFGGYLFYYKVRLDGYASINLGDKKAAENAYQLLQKEYQNKDNEKIQEAKQELESLDLDLAREILDWFGVSKD